MNKIFKNENSALGKFESFCWRMWAKEPIRFLFCGAINTLIGIIIAVLIRFIFDNLLNWDPKFTIIFFEMDLPNLIQFIIGIPIAYTTHTLIAFRVKWSFKRLLRYPLSSLPNLFLQQGFIYLFEEVCHWPSFWSYVMGAILPIPIMFFVVKFVVSPIGKKEKAQNNKKSKNDNQIDTNKEVINKDNSL